jgi:CheY-like chemotaxis protein
VALTEVAAKLLRTIPSAIAKEVAEGPKSEPLPKRKSEVKSELKVLELATLKVVDPDKVQVLVAEDQLMFRMLVQSIADKTTTWCEIDFADSGHLAVEAARVKGYHIIFMDNQMPKKTAEVIEGGAAAAKEIRTFKPDVPIVVQSNDPDRKALVENFPENVQHIIKGKLTNLAQFEDALRYNQLFIGPLLNKQQ